MAIERWDTSRGPTWVGGEDALTRQLKERGRQAVLVEIADTGTAGSLNRVRHGLGRVPLKVVVVNAVVVPGDVAPVAYRETGDAAWSKVEMGIRFASANARVLLEIS